MGYIAVMGLGVIGTPLSHLLYKHYAERFILLADEKHAKKLEKKSLYVNKEHFSPEIYTDKTSMEQNIDILFICVKNYDLINAVETIKNIICTETVIVPLQNGIYSRNYLEEKFPENIVIEGFAQGPNTIRVANGFMYQNSGVYHIGATNSNYKNIAKKVSEMLSETGLICYYDEHIQHAIWKKMMLNVSGNAITALTGIDYCMIKNSIEMQNICKKTMIEFKKVTNAIGIDINNDDIETTMEYFLHYEEAKHTSMLEDVINRRPTENEFLAGYIVKIAHEHKIDIPYIEMLYNLMKIREDVYLGNI